MNRYQMAYKKRGRVRVITTRAHNEQEAMRFAPRVLSGGWLRDGFLGEI